MIKWKYIGVLLLLFWLGQGSAEACTRVLYTGPVGMVATGRTMDWREDPKSNLYLFPRGMERRGGKGERSVHWRSKYGSVAVAGYDIGICDGMNEAGLVANLLFLPETEYSYAGDERPVMGLSIWTQYLLDNFATVAQAVEELRKDSFRLDAPDLPNGVKSRLHLSISDRTGDSAIVEYVAGEVKIYHSAEYKVLTNSPTYDLQLAINAYWQEVGGLSMLPGTNRSSDRFARASFYINAVEQSSDERIALAALISVIRNVSVPYGISTPERPHIASTRWRVVADQRELTYYFESALEMAALWVDLRAIDLSEGSGERVLKLSTTTNYSGDVSNRFVPVDHPFVFLFEA
uniref:linear amide C-N hydrolase n=1 Tax=Alistipes sp. TaxID=1872444 RepID=UPI004056FDFF